MDIWLIDFKQAYKNLDTITLIDYLTNIKISKEIIRLMRLTKEYSKAVIRLGQVWVDEIQVYRGEIQRYALYALLFIIPLVCVI